MKDLLILPLHLLIRIAKILGPGGAKPPAAVLTATGSSANLIAAGYPSHPWQLEQRFSHKQGER